MASRSAKSTAKPSVKKPKLVRDSFTIPKNEFAAIDTLKTRAIALGTSVKKSELLRAGLMVLQGLSDAAFKAAVAAVPTLKTGRPASEAPALPVRAVPQVAAQGSVKAPAKAPAKSPATAPTKAQAKAKAPAKAPVKAPVKAPAKAAVKAAAKAPAKVPVRPTAPAPRPRAARRSA